MRRAVVAVVALALLAGACTDGEDDAGGLDRPLDQLEDLAQGDDPAQLAACELQQRTIETAVAAYRAALGDAAAEASYDDLVAEGYLRVEAEAAGWTISYDPAGGPTAVPPPGVTCG